jgi:transcriptional regulator with XRE-family HTH domain
MLSTTMPRRPGRQLNPNAEIDAITLKKAMAQRINQLRQQRGWTLKEVAAKLGLPFSVYTKYEYGIYMPPADKLVHIAEVFNTTVDYLLTGNNSEGRPLHNNRLLERFHAIEHLPANDIETAITLLDALAVRHDVESALTKRTTTRKTG